ncbi:nitrilase-related carbon-nitrogen hydrolase [Pacificoceanicola onchidii]|uniref:nitrilase-related carbon-nitrogen hydrolase n=1 Tax=Pacificoceanicola onchidii TaxID=2562685 RepID=UPI0010A65466|nr:nitrilase-related carbon-nitrogen hydrolase [Pacificoceanicola onchidii]
MRFAVIQLNSQDDIDANVDAIVALTRQAAVDHKSDFVALPEYSICLTGSRDASRERAQSLQDSAAIKAIARLAKDHGIFVHLGGFIELSDDDQLYNTSVMFGRQGEVLSTYRKINLFEIKGDALADSVVHNEASHLSAGDEVIAFDVDGVTFGHAICYDVRFPDHFSALRRNGAKVIMVPAAFTQTTGRRDWERLLKERARETGAYIVAANQCGMFDKGRFKSWGHSMIVDPTGQVVVAAEEAPGILTATLDIGLPTSAL